MAAPKKVDYDLIEPGWRAGILSPKQLAKKHTEETGENVSHMAIIKHFTKLGVPRDLKAKIQAKAEAMVTGAMVTGKVTDKPSIPEREIIESNARVQADTLLAHRSDIQRGRTLTMQLLAELEAETGNIELFQNLGEILRKGDDAIALDKLNELYRKIIAMPSRVDAAKKLSDTLKNLIGLERQALGLSENGGLPPDVEQIGRIEWVVMRHRGDGKI